MFIAARAIFLSSAPEVSATCPFFFFFKTCHKALPPLQSPALALRAWGHSPWPILLFPDTLGWGLSELNWCFLALFSGPVLCVGYRLLPCVKNPHLVFFQNSLNCKEIKPVNTKGNQSWLFIGRTDAEAEALILKPPEVKSQLIGKDSDAGKSWRQGKKGTTEDEMAR